MGAIWNMSSNIMLEPFEPKMWATPWLDRAERKDFVCAADWWSQEMIYCKDGVDITRKSLVLWAANQDGGAHVDADPDPGLKLVARGLDFTWTIDEETAGVKKSSVVHVQEMHLAALRQFAYEVLNSPDLLSLASR
jgi:hypothetical protein